MNSWIIAGIILALGFLIFIFLILRSKWLQKGKHIEEYADARNKTTFRKKKEEVLVSPISEDYGGFNLQNFIVGIVIVGVTLVIGIYICSEIGSQLQLDSASYIATQEISTFIAQSISFLPILLVIGFASIILSVIVSAFGSKNESLSL